MRENPGYRASDTRRIGPAQKNDKGGKFHFAASFKVPMGPNVTREILAYEAVIGQKITTPAQKYTVGVPGVCQARCS